MRLPRRINEVGAKEREDTQVLRFGSEARYLYIV